MLVNTVKELTLEKLLNFSQKCVETETYNRDYYTFIATCARCVNR